MLFWLIDPLASPEDYIFNWRDGELYIEPINALPAEEATGLRSAEGTPPCSPIHHICPIDASPAPTQ